METFREYRLAMNVCHGQQVFDLYLQGSSSHEALQARLLAEILLRYPGGVLMSGYVQRVIRQ